MKARVDATTVIDNARSMADKLLDEARLRGSSFGGVGTDQSRERGAGVACPTATS